MRTSQEIYTYSLPHTEDGLVAIAPSPGSPPFQAPLILGLVALSHPTATWPSASGSVPQPERGTPIMNYKQFIGRISLACLAILAVEGINPRVAQAEWLQSLYAGQSAWASWNLGPGSYVLQAQTLLNLGDVDVEIYDATGQRFARGNALGSETIYFTVPQGAEGAFQVQYSMPFCVNPAGACAVDIQIRYQ